jgi:hypothetical protein
MVFIRHREVELLCLSVFASAWDEGRVVSECFTSVESMGCPTSVAALHGCYILCLLCSCHGEHFWALSHSCILNIAIIEFGSHTTSPQHDCADAETFTQYSSLATAQKHICADGAAFMQMVWGCIIAIGPHREPWKASCGAAMAFAHMCCR